MLAVGMYALPAAGGAWQARCAQPGIWNDDPFLAMALVSIAVSLVLLVLVPRLVRLLEDARLSLQRERDLQSANAELCRLNARLREMDESNMLRAREAMQTELRSHEHDVSKLTEQLIGSRQALRESEQRWKAVFESSAVGVVIGRPHGGVVAMNATLEKMLGYRQAELRDTFFSEMVPDEEKPQVRACLAELRAGTVREYHSQRRYRRRDGTLLWANTSLSVVHDGEAQVLVGIIEDITARKRAEDALAQAQLELARVSRITSMGELAASIAHELNQPLAAIVTNGQACTRWLDAAEPNLQEARAAAVRIVRDANRAAVVIARIRDFLGRPNPHRSVFHPAQVLRDVSSLLEDEARSRGIPLALEVEAELPMVSADRIQLEQVLLNLVMNALEATARIAGSQPVQMGAEETSPRAVTFRVRDHGAGIDPAERGRIFDAFYTTRPHGMGMGLAISRSIVEAHGGSLWASANPDGGETFCFTVPAAAGQEA
jgi:PAS domain S-box-containing protein